MNRLRAISQRNRYSTIDEGKIKVHSFRPTAENKQWLLIHKNALIFYINRICKYIKELLQYKNEGYIKNIMNKIFNSTNNFSDIQEIFNIPVSNMNKDILLNKTLHFLHPYPAIYV